MTSIASPTPLASPASPGSTLLADVRGSADGSLSPLTDKPLGPSFWIAAAITLLFAIVPAVLWPGDVTWIDDEPGLILNAQIANLEHHLSGHGLFGSFPVPYGPLPTQMYQLFLLFTHDLRVFVVLRAGLSAAIFAAALLWMARTLRLTPWFAAAIVLGPYLWNYQRVLWDCSLLIPISTLAVAAYAAFLRKPSAAALVTSLVATTIAPLVHLQALPLFFAIWGHVIWQHRSALRKYRNHLVVAGAVVFCINAGYLCWLTGCLIKNFMQIARVGHSDHHPLYLDVLGPLLSGRMFAATDYVKDHGPIHGPTWLVGLVLAGTLIIVPVIWLGIVLCLIHHYRRWQMGRAGKAQQAAATPGTASIRATVAGLALVALGLQLLMVLAMRIPPWVHYCFGTLPFYALFAWLAIDFLQRWRVGLPIVAVWGACLAAVLVAADLQIHRIGYVRGSNSPLLANQMQVADELSHYSNLLVWTDVPIYQAYPNALKVLRTLADRGLPQPFSNRPLLVRFAPDPAGQSSRIEMVQLHSLSELPKRAKQIDIGPATNWQ